MSSSEVIGYWRPLEGCNPYIGNEGEISKEPEIKVEVTVFTEAVDRTIEAIKKVHPYEEPVINVIPILRTSFWCKKRSLIVRTEMVKSERSD